jgi:hypothetical protein
MKFAVYQHNHNTPYDVELKKDFYVNKSDVCKYSNLLSILQARYA